MPMLSGFLGCILDLREIVPHDTCVDSAHGGAGFCQRRVVEYYIGGPTPMAPNVC